MTITKRYGKFTALNGLNMNVPKGSVYGFIGKNGSGKTTLIRVVCGLQPPTEGGFKLFGKADTERGIVKARRKVGAVVESPALYSELTAVQNMKLMFRVLGRDESAIGELLELVGLSDTGKKKARNFSLGMRQRLGIALALSSNPDFLMLDEPANGLDPQGIKDIRELIQRLNGRGITILVSSHILEELSKLASHFGFIDGGRMIKELSAIELEEALKKKLSISVSDAQILKNVLDGMNVPYKLTGEGTADIYGDISITRLVLPLAKAGCEVYTADERSEDLEGYFIKLLGGTKNA